MIRTKVFFYNIILEPAKKQVCTIEHTFIFPRLSAVSDTSCESGWFGDGNDYYGHFAGMPARTGGCVTSFNCSRSTSTLCQRTSSFFVSIGADRSE